MIKIYSVIILIIASLVTGGYLYISYLRAENSRLSDNLEFLASANSALANTLDLKEREYNATITQLQNAKNNNEKEVRYVTKIKYKIIRDKNSTCIGAVNDVFKRLREQANDKNSANTR